MAPHRSTLYRQHLREADPEKYKEYKKKKRESEKKRRDEEKRKWEEGPHTAEEIEGKNAKAETKRARERARYHKKKTDQTRQTRNSAKSSGVPVEERKRPRDMSPDEYRTYRSAQRKKQRDNESHQKKTAKKRLRKEKRRQEKEEKMRQLASSLASSSMTTPEPSGTGKLKQSVYNLNATFRKKAKALGMTSQDYARATLNLLNPKTPEKRAAIIVEQRAHPCKALFQDEVEESPEHLAQLEEELGVDPMETLEFGPAREEIISKPLHDQIKLFYCREDISRVLPHSRYSTKYGPARLMQMTIKSAHALFCQENSAKIGLTTFQGIRPRNVRLMGSIPLESCLCIYCTNVRLKIQTINKILGASGQLPSERDMLNFLTCPHEGKWPKMDCIDGKCPLCSNRMRPFEVFCRDVYTTDGLKWERWERNGDGKMEPVRKEGNMRDMLQGLEKDIQEPSKGCSFLQHLFTAYWQYSQFKACRSNPEEGEVVMVQDFGENRKAAYSAEIKSAHFGKHQITVHPVVCFYRVGESVVRESLIFLTDDITHDHHAVQEFTHRTVAHLLKKTELKKLTIWSDGAASQYKGRGSFHDLTLLPHAPQRCYYGSEHGKGESDGETGVMSQALRRATYQGQSFGNAKDMAQYLTQHYGTDRRHYILVDNIDRVDLNEDVQTIPGTRKYHQFQALKPYVLQARRFACFCTACREGKHSLCMNRDRVGTYTVHKCKPSVQTVLNEGFPETPAEPDGIPSDDREPCPKVGDYVKLTCTINKVQKNFYAVVISVTDESTFSVRFLQKSGTKYTFGSVDDEGLITSGPPDFYTWTVLQPDQWTMDHREHYAFSV